MLTMNVYAGVPIVPQVTEPAPSFWAIPAERRRLRMRLALVAYQRRTKASKVMFPHFIPADLLEDQTNA